MELAVLNELAYEVMPEPRDDIAEDSALLPEVSAEFALLELVELQAVNMDVTTAAAARTYHHLFFMRDPTFPHLTAWRRCDIFDKRARSGETLIRLCGA